MTGAAVHVISDQKHGQKDFPIWESVITFTFANGDTGEVKQALPRNGILQKIIVLVTGAAVTATVAIDDNGDNEIFTVAALAVSATPYTYNVSEPVSGIIDVGVVPSGDPGGAWVVTVTLRGI